MNRGITQEQYQMIDLLLQGRNITDIAGIIHKSRTTIYNWLEWPEIKSEIEFRKAEMKNVAKDKIAAEVNQCIVNLVDMANNSKDHRIKFQANKYLIDQALGTPGTYKEEIKSISSDKPTDTNTLKAEIEEIKNLTVIK